MVIQSSSGIPRCSLLLGTKEICLFPIPSCLARATQVGYRLEHGPAGVRHPPCLPPAGVGRISEAVALLSAGVPSYYGEQSTLLAYAGMRRKPS